MIFIISFLFGTLLLLLRFLENDGSLIKLMKCFNKRMKSFLLNKIEFQVFTNIIFLKTIIRNIRKIFIIYETYMILLSYYPPLKMQQFYTRKVSLAKSRVHFYVIVLCHSCKLKLMFISYLENCITSLKIFFKLKTLKLHKYRLYV